MLNSFLLLVAIKIDKSTEANEYRGFWPEEESKVNQHVMENRWSEEKKGVNAQPVVQSNLKSVFSAQVTAAYYVDFAAQDK